ncbi:MULTISPECIES: molybdopterin-dependent oxidoreductase [Sphingobium]|uniref:molybdopterin-dependent oxidoreductase n=1 Tax=Sphingobium TaxID=165695 RepID=UPI00159C0B1D|nr:molybdopterin-dependent oxidoreductase [Sphingobium sp. 15-1]
MSHDRHYRSCTICEAGCGLVIETASNGQVRSIKGDADDPVSQGFVCPKSQAMAGIGRDPDRLRQPLRRTQDGFEPIGWDEAFALAAEKLSAIRQEHGPDAIATYVGNPVAGNVGSVLYTGALTQAIGSRQIYTAASIDAYPRMLANALMFGDIGINPVPDIERCDFLLILGANPAVSNGSMLTLPGLPKKLAQMRERGGRIVVVDPRRTRTAEMADDHLAIQPSTDALLLLALVESLFSDGVADRPDLETRFSGIDQLRQVAARYPAEKVAAIIGVHADKIRSLARFLAAAPRAAVYGRVGTCCQPFGSIASWLIEAINALTGNLDREGGMLIPMPIVSTALFSSPYSKGQAPYGRFHTRVRKLPELGGRLPAAALAEEIATPGEGRVRALITLAGNPIRSFPDSRAIEAAVEKLDFLISIDMYLNETSRHADLILPPGDPLGEPNCTLMFGAFSPRSYARFSPALPAADPGLADWEILLRLGAALTGRDAECYDRHYVAGLVGWSMQRACMTDPPHEAIMQQLTGETGVEKLCDFFIRTGPFGDGFGQAAGITLTDLRAADHGVDRGYAPSGRLMDLIRTPDGKVNLAPAPIMADLERLDQWIAAGKLGELEPAKGYFILSGRRDLRSMNSWLHNLPNLAKGPARSHLHVHPDDADLLGLADGDTVALDAGGRQVTVTVERNADVQRGHLNLPHGWGHHEAGTRMEVAHQRPGSNYNLLSDAALLDMPSGNAVFNGLRVRLSRTAQAPEWTTAH